MTVDEVAAIIGATPGIAEGFVQHYSGWPQEPQGRAEYRRRLANLGSSQA